MPPRGRMPESPPTPFPLPVAPQPAAIQPVTRQRNPGAPRLAKAVGRPARLTFLYFLWVIILFHPQWMLAAHGLHFLLKVPLFFFGVLAVLAFPRARAGIWLWPLLAVVLYGYATLPFTENFGHALAPTKLLLLYYILGVGTLALVRRPRDAVPIVLIVLVYQYVWWAGFGALPGRVPWDPAYRNYDGFGPLMVMGITSTAYAGFATKSKRLRRLAFATAIACVVGLVSTFARGAVLGAGLVLAVAWLRSPRKGVAAAGVVLVAIVVALSGMFLFSDADRGSDTNPNFFDEMLSIKGAVVNGTGEGTGRSVLWAIARMEFRQHPVFGVGQACYGVYAAGNFRPGQLPEPYTDNPGRLYNRAVHNVFYETLAERGSVGVVLYLWLLADFWRRNRRMKERKYAARWLAGCDGKFDLRALAIALETAMIGFLACGLFYNELTLPWLYSLVIVNAMLYDLSAGAASARRTRRRGAPASS